MPEIPQFQTKIEPSTSTATYGFEVHGDDEPLTMEPTSQPNPTQPRRVPTRYVFIVIVAIVLYATTESIESVLSEPAVVTVVTTTPSVTTLPIVVPTIVANNLTTTVPTPATTLSTLTTVAQAQIEQQEVTVGGQFRPTQVPPPDTTSFERTTTVSTENASSAQPELATQVQIAPTRVSVAELTEEDRVPFFSLASLRSREMESRIVELPFGYWDCGSWFERYIIPMMSGFKACGPYYLTVEITVDFARAETMNGQTSIPITQVVDKGLVYPEGGEPFPANQPVILMVDEAGLVTWPTQTELWNNEPNVEIGVAGPWTTGSEMGQKQRVQQLLDELCETNGVLVGEAFGFNRYQADFVGHC